jgi:CubicO group peptidase (beta-lactamase class C family)
VTDNQAVAPLDADLSRWIDEERHRTGVPGAAVLLFGRDGALGGAALGHADLARGEAVTLRTLFRAASISKLFTTLLVLQEIAAGRLALDEPVNTHLTGRFVIRDRAGRPADDVTVRHLLSHSGGLPVSWRGTEFGNIVMRHLLAGGRIPRTLSGVVAGQRTVRPPGERVVYENGGIGLLGYLVAQTHGVAFGELARSRLFEPLGMHDSSFAEDVTGMQVATPYGGMRARTAGSKPAPVTRYVGAPSGSLVTNALELAAFGSMLLRGGEWGGVPLAPGALLDEAMRIQAKNHPDLDAGWGLGFAVSQLRGRRLAGHNGELPGVATRLALLPDEGLGVLVLANGGNIEFAEAVAGRVLESALGLEPEARPGPPVGIPPGGESGWAAFSERVAGRYRAVDASPPGFLTVSTNLLRRPVIIRLDSEILALDGGGGRVVLFPDGVVGRYRAAHAAGNGCRAVIEEREGRIHLWRLALHFERLK